MLSINALTETITGADRALAAHTWHVYTVATPHAQASGGGEREDSGGDRMVDGVVGCLVVWLMRSLPLG